MPSSWKAYVVPALLLALLGALGLSYYQGRKAGEYAVKFRSADSTLKASISRAAIKDMMWRSDSTAYRLAVQRYRDSGRKMSTHVPNSGTPNGTDNDHPPAPSDSAPHPSAPSDSAPHPSDSTGSCDQVIRAADAAISSCATSQAAKDSVIKALNVKLGLLLHRPHSFFSGVGGKALLLGAGFLLGRAIH